MMDKKVFATLCVSFALFLGLYLVLGGFGKMDDNVLNVYMSRKEVLMKELFEEFTEQTGIRINYVQDSDNSKLLERIKREGEDCPADMLITADVARLILAKKQGVLQSINNEVLMHMIPPHLRDEEGMWYGLTTRARVIAYVPKRVSEEELKYLRNYEDLADERWKGRIIMRSSTSAYNQSLLASIVASIGVDAAEKWVKGLVNNFTRQPQGGDIDQMRAIASGESDITVVNSYYFARLAASDNAADKEVASKIKVIFPNQDNRGTHVNISGAGILKYARHVMNAEKFLEFMVSNDAQGIYARKNHEYPIVQGIEWSPVLQELGQFKGDLLPLHMLEDKMDKAVEIMNKYEWR